MKNFRLIRLPVCLTAWVCAAVLMSGCGGSGAGSTGPTPPTVVEKSFDFAQGALGWVAGSADYNANTAPNDVIAEVRSLPTPFTGTGYFHSGTNRSDDLFLYIKTPISGLVSGVIYRVTAKLEFLTDVPSGCVGVGGSPGESVWLVLAASTSEPTTVLTGSEFRVNIDRGNQSKSGASGIVLGTMANSVTDCGPRRWESKALSTPAPSPLLVKADDKGVVWILIGFDSGFEALSRLYYQRLGLSLQPM